MTDEPSSWWRMSDLRPGDLCTLDSAHDRLSGVFAFFVVGVTSSSLMWMPVAGYSKRSIVTCPLDHVFLSSVIRRCVT